MLEILEYSKSVARHYSDWSDCPRDEYNRKRLR